MFPMVLLEAWANGKPVIGTRLGATADLIDEGDTGLLFESGNSLDLGQKIESLYRSPQRVAEMGTNARALVETKYSPRASQSLLMEIFRKVGRTDIPAGMAILETA
jgi:glycosyltransferase involved in cell wall biosynthesis